MNSLDSKIAQAVAALEPDLVAFISSIVKIPSLPGTDRVVQEAVPRKLESLGLAVDMFGVKREELAQPPAFTDDGFSFEDRGM